MLKKDMQEMMNEEKDGTLGDLLKGKEGMQKVTVMAEDEEGLEKGLSKAQKILKEKYGEDAELEDEMEDMMEGEEDEEELCPMCEKMPCECE